ncbi:MAG: extracellular solute-binding protein [Streptococcaceae bacterium]|nr:extracellular solute-binding protein [Streptococcaceae bacterium]
MKFLKLKKFLFGSIAVLVGAALLTACSNGSSSNNGKTTITFWAATNPTQLKFWQQMAKDYEAKNPNVTVKVTEMKNSPTSEASIQAAIASGTQPTLSENISRSFAAQLAASKAIVPLNNQTEFNGIVTKRGMTNTMSNWKFAGGKEYVLPLYVNPMLFVWNITALKSLGIDKAPTTYSEWYAAAQKLQSTNSKLSLWGSAGSSGPSALVDPTGYQRWFDFFPLYDAASNGAPFVQGTSYKADTKSLTNVYSFVNKLASLKGFNTEAQTNSFETGQVLTEVLGPWTFPNWQTQFPNLVYGKNYTLTAPPVPDGQSTSSVKTYADSKGVVIYSKATDAQKKAAMSFIEFVYGDSKNDLTLLNMTGLPPAKDNLATDSAFKSYFEKNPQMKAYANAINDAIPAMDNANYNNIQQAFGTNAWIPSVKGTMLANDAVKATEKAVKSNLTSN